MDNEYLLQVQLELRDQLSRDMERVNNELNAFRSQLRTSGDEADRLANRVSSSTAKMKAAFEQVAKAAKYTVVGLTGLGIGALKSFADTEAGIKKVQTISKKSFEEIQNGAYTLAQRYGSNVGDILQANYDMVSSMGDISNSSLVMDQAAQLSMAGFTSMGGSVNALSSVMNAYKMEVSEVTRVSDILMTVQNNGVTTIEELQASLYNVLPTAASMKVGFEEIAAAMATMTANKVPTATAATQLKSALAELAKSGTTADKVFRQITGGSFQEFINKGGTMAQAFELIAKSADVTGISLYDIFGSVEAAGAVLNLTGENLKTFGKNLDAVDTSAGTTKGAVDVLSTGFLVQFNQMKGVAKELADKIGLELVPYVNQLKTALENVDVKSLLSQENIEATVSLAGGFLKVSAAVWGINAAIAAANTAIVVFKGSVAALGVIATSVASNPLVAAMLLASGAGLHLGTQLVNLKNTENEILEKNFNKWDKKNPLLNTPIEGLKPIEKVNENAAPKSLEEMAANARNVRAELEKTQKVKDELLSTKVGGMEGVVIPVDGAGGKGGGAGKKVEELSDLVKLQKEFNELNSKVVNKGSLFNMTELQQAEEKLKSLERIMSEGLNINMSKEALSPIKQQYEETKAYVEKLKSDLKATEFKQEFEKEFNELNLEFEIFGVEEEERLLKTIRTLETQVSKAISDGMIGQAKEIGEELKKAKENYKVTYEIPKEGRKNLDEGIKTLSNSIYQIADVVKSDFLNTVSVMINGIGVISKSLQAFSVGGGGVQGATSGIGSIFGSLGSFFGKGSTTAMFGKISAGLAIGGAVVGMASSLLGGGKKDAEREKKNAENEKKYEENTNALKQLGEQIKKNSTTLKDFAITLISTISRSPTLHRITGGQNTLKTMEDVMMENKDFGNLSFLVKESKKTGWSRKRKSWSKNREMSEPEMFRLLGYDKSTNLDAMDLDELKSFRSSLNTLDNSTLKKWADGQTSRRIDSVDMSGLNQYKSNIDEFIHQIETLQKEQKELFRNATLEGFEGISVIDEKQLTEQYTKMFEDMGLDTKKYADDIKEMVDANQVLVNSMEDVRSSFIDSLISGEGDFVGSMGSYFQKLIKNAAMTVYDVLYSEVDNSMNDTFMRMSEKLLKMKETGSLDFSNFWSDFNLDDVIKAQEIETNFQEVVNDLRKQLKAAGIKDEIINSFLPSPGEDEVQKRIDAIKATIQNNLSGAMSQALIDNDFTSFEKSMGQSIYNSVKDSLIKAFADSEAYKKYVDKYFDYEAFEKELNGTDDPLKAFEMMQKYMESLYGKLESNNMGFDDAIKGNKEEEKNLGNSYYSDGPSKIEITITQNFTANGDETIYQIAKKGTLEALEEIKKQSKALGVI
ncbi:MAG: phage tail tape measure protein [Cetobacterium sp.]